MKMESGWKYFLVYFTCVCVCISSLYVVYNLYRKNNEDNFLFYTCIKICTVRTFPSSSSIIYNHSLSSSGLGPTRNPIISSSAGGAAAVGAGGEVDEEEDEDASSLSSIGNPSGKFNVDFLLPLLIAA